MIESPSSPFSRSVDAPPHTSVESDSIAFPFQQRPFCERQLAEIPFNRVGLESRREGEEQSSQWVRIEGKPVELNAAEPRHSSADRNFQIANRKSQIADHTSKITNHKSQME